MACLARVGAGIVLGAGLQQLCIARSFPSESTYRGKPGDKFVALGEPETEAILKGFEGIGGDHKLQADKKAAQHDSLSHGYHWIRISTTKGFVDERITMSNLEGLAGANLRFGMKMTKILRGLGLLSPKS